MTGPEVRVQYKNVGGPSLILSKGGGGNPCLLLNFILYEINFPTPIMVRNLKRYFFDLSIDMLKSEGEPRTCSHLN